MRKAIRKWRRPRLPEPGLNSTSDVDKFLGEIEQIRALDEAPTGEIPVVVSQSTPDPAPVARGLCSACRKPVRLRRDGLISSHKGCDGGGQQPLALEDCEECSVLDLPVLAATYHALAHPVLEWDAEAA